MLPQTALRESSTCTVYRCVHSLLKPLVESQRHVILLLQSCQCWIHLGAYSVQVHIQLPHQSQELLHTTNKKTGWLCVRDTINCIKLNNTIKDKIVTPHRGCRFNFQNNSNHIRYRLYVAESLLNSFRYSCVEEYKLKKKSSALPLILITACIWTMVLRAAACYPSTECLFKWLTLHAFMWRALTSDWLLSEPELRWNRRHPCLSLTHTDKPPTAFSDCPEIKCEKNNV